MKLKILLIGLIVSFQTFALSKTFYYPTGEVKQVQEFVDGKASKDTAYYKTGEVGGVKEYIDGKKSKTTHYRKNGEIKNIEKY